MRPFLPVLAVVLVGCSSSSSPGTGASAGDPKAYLDKAAAQPGAVRTPSGLVYRELRAGSGGSPSASDTVTVNYRGTLVDGTEFDSSYKRNEPAQFPLNQVIPCWTEGLQKMKVGGKAELVCPASIAYGEGWESADDSWRSDSDLRGGIAAHRRLTPGAFPHVLRVSLIMVHMKVTLSLDDDLVKKSAKLPWIVIRH